MRENFDKAFELVIGHEGGFTDDRRDRGNWTTGVIGKGQLKGTKYGVSAMSYPSLDIKNLTLDQAKAIYKRDFWDAAKCDQLPPGLDYLLFDSAINHGVAGAVRILQRALGVNADGALGPVTLGQVIKRDAVDLIKEFCVRRFLFWAGIGTFKTYGLGWFRRGVDTLVTALSMIPPSAPALDESKVEPEATPGFFSKMFRRV